MLLKPVLGMATALMTLMGAAHAQDTVKMGAVVELSGNGATAGTNWRDGLRVAVDEMNAEGGILGKQVQMLEYDTQTDPQISRAMVQKAIDEGVFALWGTVYSGSTLVNMIVAKQNDTPQFVGSEAPTIVQQGNPYVFRTSSGSQKGIPALMPYFTDTLKVKKVAVTWINNEFGRGGRDVFVEEAKKAGLELVVDVPSEQAQTDYAADVSRLKESGAEAIFVYLNQEESARFLMEAKKQGLSAPLIGEVILVEPTVIKLAGEAANGAIAHVGILANTDDVEGIKAFRTKFSEKFKREPSHDSIKGYIGAWATKYVTELVGEFDGEKFAEKMHGLCLPVAEYPNMLLDTCWDDTGEMSRPSFMVQVQNGEQKVIGQVPAN